MRKVCQAAGLSSVQIVALHGYNKVAKHIVGFHDGLWLLLFKGESVCEKCQVL